MEFDNSWRALVNPGAAAAYFDPPPSSPLAAGTAYSETGAWWLAELSRLVYRDGRADGAAGLERFLAPVGLRQRRFFRRRSTQCALIEPRIEAAAGPAVLSFRGTDGLHDWLTNLRTALQEWPAGGSVHAGFQRALDDVWPQLEPELEELGDRPVLYTGHSLGGALATLAASRRAARTGGAGGPLAVYTFGGPRVGDEGFGETLAGVRLYRVVNRGDWFAGLPPESRWLRFCHVGEPRPISLPPRGERPPGSKRPPLPGRRRWFDPPPRLCDHSPVNYVACLERLARG